jgi:hypothetical protein
VILTPLQVADYWIAAGGPKNRATEWVAIARGESAYDTAAVSSAGAIGLWQIMPFNAAPNGVTVADLYNPLENARVAVRMSGRGGNCAAWDSCYADIYTSGRYTFLAYPEPGSADYNNMQIVATQLGTDKLGGAVPPGAAIPAPQAAKATEQMNALATKLYPALTKTAVAQRLVLQAMFTGRMRP